MKVLVTGGSGGLGRYVVCEMRDKAEVFAPAHVQIDITDVIAVLRHFHAVKPQVVIHLAAMTDTTACEKYPEQAALINTQGTLNIARACHECGVRLIYMSTDAVFSGVGPHVETKQHIPTSVYGWSKYAGEVATMRTAHLIVRANFFTRYCRGKTSFAEYVVSEASAGHDFTCYEGVISTPVFAKTLAERIVKAVLEREHGILHVASSDAVNRVEQAAMICEAYGLLTSGIVVDSTKKSDGRLAAPRGTCSTVREEIAKMVREEPL